MSAYRVKSFRVKNPRIEWVEYQVDSTAVVVGFFDTLPRFTIKRQPNRPKAIGYWQLLDLFESITDPASYGTPFELKAHAESLLPLAHPGEVSRSDTPGTRPVSVTITPTAEPSPGAPLIGYAFDHLPTLPPGALDSIEPSPRLTSGARAAISIAFSLDTPGASKKAGGQK